MQSKLNNMRTEIFKKFILLLCTCTIPLAYSCNKKDSGPIDMTPIFLAVHRQASIQAKDFEGEFNQFDSTKPFYIYTDYNFQGSIRNPLESMSLTDSSNAGDNLFSNKVFVAKSIQFRMIDTLPKWDDIHKRMQPFNEKLDKKIDHSTFRQYQNSGEFDYYLVRMLKPTFNKKNNVYSTELHITDNVFENRGYYYSVKFRFVDNKVIVVSIRQYGISISLPPPAPKHKHKDDTHPPS